MNKKVNAAKMQKLDNYNSPNKKPLFNNMSININMNNNNRQDAIPEDIK